jgi:hypothetical protein
MVVASVKKPLRFLDYAEVKLYSDSHVFYATIACEANHASSTHPGALDNCLVQADMGSHVMSPSVQRT